MHRFVGEAGRPALGRSIGLLITLLVCMFSLSFVTSHCRGECIDYRDYFRAIGGIDVGAAVTALDLSGDLLALGEGSRLGLYDLADPTAPVERGSVDLGTTPERIELAGSLAFVSLGYAGLRIVDISNPEAPILRGGINSTGPTYAVSLMGDVACLASLDGFFTVDVTNPDAPAVIDRLRWAKGRDVATAGNLAFVAGGSNGVFVLDVSDPAAPNVIGNLMTGGYARSVALDGARLWVADDASGIVAVDVTDPTTPVLEGASPVEGLVERILTDGSLLFAAAGNDGVYSYDAFNPVALTLIGKIAPHQYAYDLVSKDDHVYFADYALRIADITNPRSPLWIGHLDTPGELLDVQTRGDLCVLADGEAGLRIADVSNPATPTLLGAVGTPGSCLAVRISGDYAYAADEVAGVEIVRIADPTNPTIVATVPLPDVSALAVEGDFVYVACGWNGLYILDVSDAEHPVQRGVLDDPAIGLIRGVDVKDGLAVLIDRCRSRLHMVDVQDPDSPALLSDVLAPGNPTSARIQGPYVYATTDSGHLDVYSIADPLNPIALNSISMAITCAGISIDGAVAYATIGTGGIEVFDLSDPASPVAIGGVDTPAHAVRAVAGPGCIYVADREDGLVILPGQCTAPSGIDGRRGGLAAEGLQVAPNPSTGPTHIRVDLVKPGRLSVALYDVAGRRVRRCDAGWSSVGPHDLVWDGRDEKGRPVARGVYLARLEGSRSPARAITILR